MINHAVLVGSEYHILVMRMTAVHGAIASFDPDTNEWTEYIERLQFYFAANNIRDGPKQKAILLSNCGASTFRLLRSINSAS